MEKYWNRYYWPTRKSVGPSRSYRSSRSHISNQTQPCTNRRSLPLVCPPHPCLLACYRVASEGTPVKLEQIGCNNQFRKLFHQLSDLRRFFPVSPTHRHLLALINLLLAELELFWIFRANLVTYSSRLTDALFGVRDQLVRITFLIHLVVAGWPSICRAIRREICGWVIRHRWNACIGYGQEAGSGRAVGNSFADHVHVFINSWSLLVVRVRNRLANVIERLRMFAYPFGGLSHRILFGLTESNTVSQFRTSLFWIFPSKETIEELNTIVIRRRNASRRRFLTGSACSMENKEHRQRRAIVLKWQPY